MHSTTTNGNNTVNVKLICTSLFSYFNKIRLFHDFFVFLVSTTTQWEILDQFLKDLNPFFVRLSKIGLYRLLDNINIVTPRNVGRKKPPKISFAGNN